MANNKLKMEVGSRKMTANNADKGGGDVIKRVHVADSDKSERNLQRRGKIRKVGSIESHVASPCWLNV